LTRLRYGRNVDDPLTGRTEKRPRDMTTQLLRYANRAAIAEALTAEGYSVSRVTVNRWARGAEMPEIARRMILALFGHEQTETPRPLWAEGLEERIEARLTASGPLPDRVAERIAARLELPQQPGGEGAPSNTEAHRDSVDTERSLIT
jgi:hypothetical protein